MEKYDFTHRKKTEYSSKIPILTFTQIIIDKYENHPNDICKDRLLPILSNQKMYAYLKEIPGLCKLIKNLPFTLPNTLLQRL